VPALLCSAPSAIAAAHPVASPCCALSLPASQTFVHLVFGNRLQEELAQLKPGERIERVAPPPPPLQSSQRTYGHQAVGKLLGAPEAGSSGSAPGAGAPSSSGSSGSLQPRKEELSGMWEVLTLDDDGRPFLDRWVNAVHKWARGVAKRGGVGR